MTDLKAEIAKKSNVVLILAKVARVIIYVSLGLCVAGIVDLLLTGANYDIEIKGIHIYPLLQADLHTGASKEDLVWRIVEAMLQLGVAQALLYLITSVFRHISESETPFTDSVVRSLKTMAVLLGAVLFIDNGYLGVVVAFVVYAIALIFEYGGQLQRQVDETL
ncbi:MAG: hypothetical protein PHY12_06380 [Eubacteriales bacterium]|nr:hypothetical protein [Eubacteriales bacterium]